MFYALHRSFVSVLVVAPCYGNIVPSQESVAFLYHVSYVPCAVFCTRESFALEQTCLAQKQQQSALQVTLGQVSYGNVLLRNLACCHRMGPAHHLPACSCAQITHTY